MGKSERVERKESLHNNVSLSRLLMLGCNTYDNYECTPAYEETTLAAVK
jgi:hypothetical protein